MSLIPEENLKKESPINLAPMIDFLFLMLAFFAILAMTRSSLLDTKLSLAQLKSEKNSSSFYGNDDFYQINLTVASDGSVNWITDMKDYQITSNDELEKEIHNQYHLGIIPKDKTKTKFLLHIDKEAPWEPIAKLIFSVRQSGFEAYPLYQPIENQNHWIKR